MSTNSMNNESTAATDGCGATACSCTSSTAHGAAGAAGDDGGHRGQQYWRSIEEFADTPEFREQMYREFPAGASEMLDGEDRRGFLKIMGASLALAGLTLSGCRRLPEQKIVPHAARPLDRTPGIPVHYATAFERGGVGYGVLATSYDGRPIKVDGNPEHPVTGGGSDVYMQASILDLFDPDRSRGVKRKTESGRETASRQAFESWVEGHFGSIRGSGRGVAVLCEATGSPSMRAMRRSFQNAFPQASWHEYEPLANDNEYRGATMAFGYPVRPHYNLENARVVLSLDADFLGQHPDMIRLTRQFAAARRVDGPRDAEGPCRLYAFESAVSVTGANADHRVALRRRDVAAIAARLFESLGGDLASGAGSALSAIRDEAIRSSTPDDELQTILDALRADLDQHRGLCPVVVGPGQPPEVHMLGHLLNAVLGNIGRSVSYTRIDQPIEHADSLERLVELIETNRVDTVVIIGGNPVYNAPADIDVVAALERVAHSVHLSDYDDETSQHCTWHVNRTHYLEAWGDVTAYDGTISVTQPLIEPLFDGISAIELLAMLNGDEVREGEQIVQRTLGEIVSLETRGMWQRILRDGFIPGFTDEMFTPPLREGEIGGHLSAWSNRRSDDSASGLELTFIGCNTVYDGRFANNGWLQELPDPITKVTWDNVVLLSPSRARDLGVTMSVSDRSSDMVEISIGGRTIEAVAIAQPGQAPDSITIALGYGRAFDGRICADAGFNSYVLRSRSAMWSAEGVEIRRLADRRYKVASTQDHHPIGTVGGDWAQRRLPSLYREANMDEYREHEHFAQQRAFVPHRLSLWNETHPFHNRGENAHYAWGMTVDLSSCTGCNACVIACQAENNIPIVGKDQVLRQREMHWLRIDRYYRSDTSEGSEDRPNTIAMIPMMCVHCENAPCEQVCPVAATVHDEDGMNVMVYNRCIGTRYCSNNCPYKVRRFNYFDYHRRDPLRQTRWLHVQPDYYSKPQATAHPLRQLQFNPEVSVRVRGVMEKCTYCVQRVARAKIQAKNEWTQQDPATRPSTWRVNDDITTACAQACPANAIVFGDLNDPESRVSQVFGHHRAYEMLEELNTKPRTKYIARIRNQIPSLALAPPAAGGH